jgi:hypothetical protein
MPGVAPMIMRHPVPPFVNRDLSSKYDYCMVFVMQKDANKQPTIYPDYCNFIVNELKVAGLEVFSYMSAQNDEVVVLIRSPVSLDAVFVSEISSI